eukprot:m.276591 g.276591  ORF g.276591 m.276591 type:complete len:61 (-) comp15713_c2_seq3:7310-7492(-)
MRQSNVTRILFALRTTEGQLARVEATPCALVFMFLFGASVQERFALSVVSGVGLYFILCG